MYTQSAEQLWKKITEHVADNKYSIRQTTLGLDSFIKTFQISKLDILLWHIILLL